MSVSINTETDTHLGVSVVSKKWEKSEKFKNTNLVVNIHPELMKIKKTLQKNIKIDGKKILFNLWWVVDNILNDYFKIHHTFPKFWTPHPPRPVSVSVFN